MMGGDVATVLGYAVFVLIVVGWLAGMVLFHKSRDLPPKRRHRLW